MDQTTTILAIDQGTTSSRAILFDESGRPLITAQKEFPQIYPAAAWVEHNPQDILESTFEVCRQVLERAVEENKTPAAIGITNQRETTLIWDRKTGQPIYNAIVWQDRRTAQLCAQLNEQGHAGPVAERSGLLIDPYFSSTKVAWIMDNVEGARDRAERGELAFGTVDSFLLWHLTGGDVHATDATNAARTNLYNIHHGNWDDELLALFRVPRSLLPEVRDCATDFGRSDGALLGQALPIAGIAGDQQAAAIGQACIEPGMVKSTYGTGCFVILNTGDKPVRSENRLLTTVAYQLAGKRSYAIEGSIFVSGAAVQWLRDGLGLIEDAAETEALARSLPDNRGVYLVPAFTGLGAPYWDPEARGAIFGLTRDSGRAELARATLESVCYQTHDLFDAMSNDGARPATLRVDGGMVANNWVMQFLADVLDVQVDRPVVSETTALGAAFLAGLQIGIYDSLDEIGDVWQQERSFAPSFSIEERHRLLAAWHKAVDRVRESGH